MRTYRFKAELERDEDGRWSSWIDRLPGCAAWGYTQEEALTALRDAAAAYVADMLEAGENVPTEATGAAEAPQVAVTL